MIKSPSGRVSQLAFLGIATNQRTPRNVSLSSSKGLKERSVIDKDVLTFLIIPWRMNRQEHVNTALLYIEDSWHLSIRLRRRAR